MDRIKPDEGIYRVQGSTSPFLDQGQNLVGHTAYSGRGCIDAVHFHQMVLDVPIGGAPGIQGDNLSVQIHSQGPLPFADQFRLEGPIAIAGRSNFYLPHACLYLLATLAILSVGLLILVQMRLKFSFQSPSRNSLSNGVKTPSLPRRLSPFLKRSWPLFLKASKSKDFFSICIKVSSIVHNLL